MAPKIQEKLNNNAAIAPSATQGQDLEYNQA